MCRLIHTHYASTRFLICFSLFGRDLSKGQALLLSLLTTTWKVFYLTYVQIAKRGKSLENFRYSKKWNLLFDALRLSWVHDVNFNWDDKT